MELVAIVLVVVLVSACTGFEDGSSDGDANALPARASATVEIIAANVESSIGGADFGSSTAGQELVAGDQVRTDDTGFGELSYPDGSWQRIAATATLTVDELAAPDTGATTATSVDLGRTWNSVRESSAPDDAYELTTPVATATVAPVAATTATGRRGTFATDCPDADVCTFWVVDGTLAVTPLDGDPVTLDAPAVLEVRRDEPVGEPRVVAPDVLRADPWIDENLALDLERTADDSSDGRYDSADSGEAAAPATPEQLRNASLVGAYSGTRTGVSTNLLPEAATHVEPGSIVQRNYEFAQECADGVCTMRYVIDGAAFSGEVTFDGTSYSLTTDEPSGCLHDDGSAATEASSVIRYDIRWTPTAARLLDGRWVVTELEGTHRVKAEVLSPLEEIAANCTWDTVDGTPYVQEVSLAMSRS